VCIFFLLLLLLVLVVVYCDFFVCLDVLLFMSLPVRDGQNPESDWSRSMAFFAGFGVESECVCVNLSESESRIKL